MILNLNTQNYGMWRFILEIHELKLNFFISILFYNFVFKLAEGIRPTLAELEKFEDQPEGIDVECILSISFLIVSKFL